MTDYLNAHGISGGCRLGLFAVYIQTKNSIKEDGSGIPIILSDSQHYCVGIGYKNINGKQLFINNGYGSTVWVNAGTMVTSWTMEIN